MVCARFQAQNRASRAVRVQFVQLLANRHACFPVLQFVNYSLTAMSGCTSKYGVAACTFLFEALVGGGRHMVGLCTSSLCLFLPLPLAASASLLCFCPPKTLDLKHIGLHGLCVTVCVHRVGLPVSVTVSLPASLCPFLSLRLSLPLSASPCVTASACLIASIGYEWSFEYEKP